MNAQPSETPEPEHEWSRADDRIIGTAMRWSVGVGIVAALAVAAIVWQVRREPSPPPTRLTPLSAPAPPSRPHAAVPVARFTDITESAGITFMHRNGAYGDKLLPETMGGGVAWLDYDNDGRQDLLFVNSTDWPWRVSGGHAQASHGLFRNEGGGRFSDVTAGSGLDVETYGMGVAIGDYDNDGHTDIFMTGVGGSRLFRNTGTGTFQDVTARSGVGGGPDDWSTCAAFFDYDRDGRLDLFVGYYVKWSPEIDAELGFKIDGRTRAYGQPTNFEGTFSRLYRNLGDGTFADVSAEAGVQVRNPVSGVPAAKSLGVAPVDIDRDGWIDLVVANDTVPNFVFMNRPGKEGPRFEEIGAMSGVAFDNYGNTRGAMGIDASYYRNDEHLGIGVGNFANEMTALYVARDKPTHFSDEAITEGIGPATRLVLTFGLFFFDYDLDGWLDLLSVNGHLEEEINKIQHSQQYRQPAQLFWNALGAGHAGFVHVPPEKAGTDLFQPIVGRGSAYADIDDDGDLDVVFTQINGPPLLLRNDRDNGHHWIRLKLVGGASNRDAIGAWIHVGIGERRLSRQVMPTRGYLSQSELPVTIGVGRAERPDRVEIEWPSGARQVVEAVRVNDMTVVVENP